jgi:hypothetical protein
MQDDTHVVLQHDSNAVTLPSGENLVGRSSGCFLRIDDPGVSRVHFKIVVGQEVTIQDLESKNGTLVNGKRLESKRVLRDGDQILVGGRMFRVSFVVPSFEDGDETPFPADSASGTLRGVGAVRLEESCPRCHRPLPAQSAGCVHCGLEQRKAGAKSATLSEIPALGSRRRHLRHRLRLATRFATGTVSGEGEVEDLSLSGLFIATKRNVSASAGDPCTVEIADNSKTVVFRGFVRHVIRRSTQKRPAGLGIEFTFMSPEAEAWLVEQLHRIKTRESKP